MADISEVTSSDPVELLAAGRRNLAVKDYPSAVSCLGKACELLVTLHGEQADQCGEAYLWYGKALLGLSREESGVLGDGLPGTEDADEGAEGDNANTGSSDEDEKTGDTAEVNSLNEDKSDTLAEQKNKTEDASEPSSTTDSGKGETPTNGTEGDEDEGEDGDGDAVEDEVENLQIAWETLELARSILFKRVKDSETVNEARALLAEAHLLLGEVALESETYDKAVIDMEKCLELQKDLFSADDRRIAETHYQIGLANSLASNFEESVVHFKAAAEILEARIRTLEMAEAPSSDPTVKKFSAADPFYSVSGEIKELRELLPEIREKIQDMMEYKAETIKAVRAQLCPPTNGDGPSTSSSLSTSLSSAAFTEIKSSSTSQPKQVSDISHLIKRKRKPSQEDTSATRDDTTQPAKRPNP